MGGGETDRGSQREMFPTDCSGPEMSASRMFPLVATQNKFSHFHRDFYSFV